MSRTKMNETAESIVVQPVSYNKAGLLGWKYAFFFGCSVEVGSSSNDDIVADNENFKESI